MTNTPTTPTLSDLAGLIRSFDIGADASRLMVRLSRLVAEGRPVPHEHVTGIVDELGIDQEKAPRILAAYAERDERGDIIGAAPGITLRPTTHRFITDAGQVWACCIIDTLTVPVVLGREARVASESPVSKEIVGFTVTPDGVSDVQPADAVVTFPGLVPGAADARRFVLDVAEVTAIEQIWETYCVYAHAFAAQHEAQAWLGDRDDVVFASPGETFGVVRGIADSMLAHE